MFDKVELGKSSELGTEKAVLKFRFAAQQTAKTELQSLIVPGQEIKAKKPKPRQKLELQ